MSVAGNGAPASGATEDVVSEKQSASTVMDGLSSSKVTGTCFHVTTQHASYQFQSSTMIHLECFR
jgi:hypothetical protein